MGHEEHPDDRSIPVAETPRGVAPTTSGARSMEETPRGGGEDTELLRDGSEVGRQVKLPRDLLDAAAGAAGTAAGHACLLLYLPVTVLYRLILH